MSQPTEHSNGGPPDGSRRGGAAGQKEFRLTSFSIDNRISVLVIILLVAVFGINSYVNLPKESSPDITVPNILVITTYPGVSPEDMESLITRPLEDELAGISDIKEMTSTSMEGYSNITLEFETDIDIDEALQKVREKVDLAKPELPSEAEDPLIQEINLSEFPIMQVNVSGQYDLVRLKEIAEDLQDRIEAIPSVLEVNLAGGLEREVKVDVNLPRLKYYGLTFGDVIAAIQGENVTVPGGSIDVGNKKFLLRVPGEYETVQPIEDIVVDAPELEVPQQQLEKLCLAGALMARIAHVDKQINDYEIKAIVDTLQADWDLTEGQASFVAGVAASETAEELDGYRLSREFYQATSREERLGFIEALFHIAAADGEAAHEEIEAIRGVARTLKLTHREFIDAKLTVPKDKRAT